MSLTLKCVLVDAQCEHMECQVFCVYEGTNHGFCYYFTSTVLSRPMRVLIHLSKEMDVQMGKMFSYYSRSFLKKNVYNVCN